MTTTILPILLSLALASPPSEASAEAVQVINFDTLTLKEATRLKGKLVRVSFLCQGIYHDDGNLVGLTGDWKDGLTREVWPLAGSFKRIVVACDRRFVVEGVMDVETSSDDVEKRLVIHAARPVQPSVPK